MNTATQLLEGCRWLIKQMPYAPQILKDIEDYLYNEVKKQVTHSEQKTPTDFKAALTKDAFKAGVAQEREACANVCEALARDSGQYKFTAGDCANAIRARSKA